MSYQQSTTHLSHTHRWSCVPVCCCSHTHTDPCGRPALKAPWRRPLRPPPPLPPVCEPSPTATSHWVWRQAWWSCHDNAAPAFLSWEPQCEAHWGKWLVHTTLQMKVTSMVSAGGLGAVYKDSDWLNWTKISHKWPKNTTVIDCSEYEEIN